MRKRRARPRPESGPKQSPDLIAFIEQTQEDDLKLWLVRGFTENDWGDFSFDIAPTVPTQIQSVFLTSSADAQEKLRRAVVRAIAEWSVRSRPSILADFCSVAAYTKASRVAPMLKTIIATKLVERYDHDPKIGHLISVAIGTLIGFATLPDAADAIETLYFDDRVPVRYTAQLLHGMTRFDSKNYPRYLHRFTVAATHNPDLYALDVVMNRLIDDVTPEIFAREFHRLDAETIEHLVDLLPHAHVSYDAASNDLIFWREPRKVIPVGPLAAAAAVPQVVNRQMDQHRQASSNGFAYMLEEMIPRRESSPPRRHPEISH